MASDDAGSDLSAGTGTLITGTVEQLLKASRMPKGKILNALEFPSRRSTLEDIRLSSEAVAWTETSGTERCDVDESYPISHLRWGLAGLKGSYTFWHLDSDGFNTFIDVKNDEGEKWWIIATGPPGYFGKLRCLLNGGFGLQSVPSELKLEAILLTKGTRL